jgi:hypothetical protein
MHGSKLTFNGLSVYHTILEPIGAGTESLTTVGFVGLGNMGTPMADHLLAAGFELIVYDLDPARLSRLGGFDEIHATCCSRTRLRFLYEPGK